MDIRSLMVPNPITVTIHARIEEAIEVMKKNAIRHLPVVDKENHLRGLLTMADLKQALIHSMLGELTLTDMMIQNPFTVEPDDDVEVAARLIYTHKIGGLPVIHNNFLVGIITETDILRAFIDMLGILSNSARIDVRIGEAPSDLNRAIGIIHDHGGDIIHVGMTAQQSAKRTYYFRLTPCQTLPIRKALVTAGFTVEATSDH